MLKRLLDSILDNTNMARKKQTAKSKRSQPLGSAPPLPAKKSTLLSYTAERKEILAAAQPVQPDPTSAPDQTAPDALALDDPATDILVDEIVADEADRLLAAGDQAAGTVPPPLLTAHPRAKSWLRVWLSGHRGALSILLVLIIVGLAATPTSRYFLLNSAGVRASTALAVWDAQTNQPLKNVQVSLPGVTAKTDKNGIARLERLRLGSQTLTISKVAFAESRQQLTIGWGSNPLDPVKLKAVGSRYTLVLSDFLSGKAIAGAEATSGEATARSNEKGELVLTVPQTDQPEVEIRLNAENYRGETLKFPTATRASQAVKLVPARKVIFVFKRAGKYDVYRIDADGKNEQKLLAGTGSEQPETMALVSHSTKELAAFVSTRDNVRNKDGFLLSTLNLVNISDGRVTKLGQSERIQVLDWIGDRLIYVKIAEGQSAASSQRHRLLSYDLKTGQQKELAASNYFNDVMVARGAVYYSPAVYKVNGPIGLFRIDPDGPGKKTISTKEAWNLFRTGFDRLSVSMGQDWYQYGLADGTFTKATGASPTLVSRLYIASPDDTRSLWTEDQGGTSTLLAYDHATKQDKVLHAETGLKYPIRWLDNDHVVYRVTSGAETADYVMSLSGGEPKKVADVTPVAGTDRWYYY